MFHLSPAWRHRIAAMPVFLVFVNPSWYADATAQAQLAYARALGKPVLFLVPRDSRHPEVKNGEESYTCDDLEETAHTVGMYLYREGLMRP